MIRMVSGALALLGGLTIGAVAQTTQFRPARGDSIRTAAVTYISGQSVYINAGRAEGVREGASLEVMRGASVIATMRAAFLASHSSSCEIVTSTSAPAVGDSVRFRPAADTAVVAVAPVEHDASASARWNRPFRGHIGLRFLSVSEPNNPGGSFTQPSADVHVEATSPGGTSVGVVLDSRSRQTIGARELRASALDQRTLVYQAAVSLMNQSSGARISAGRQYSPATSVSLLDGVTIEMNRATWGLGAFSGLEPDVATMDFSSDVRDAGAYLQVHNRPDAGTPWSVTTGAVDSRDLGHLNRDFGFAQLSVSSQVLSLYATQEVDFNSGWKVAAGEPSVSPTSTFATLFLRPADELSIQAGVDNRRNVRLYRDYVTPETQFDDAYRQGAWAGMTFLLPYTLRLGGDARVSRGGVAGDANYYTGSIGVGPITGQAIELRLRSTAFRTQWSTGWLHSGSIGFTPVGVLHLELNGGLRTQIVSADTAAPILLTTLSNAQWIGASVDVGLGRSWYALASFTRDGAGVDLTNQIYLSLLFRF